MSEQKNNADPGRMFRIFAAHILPIVIAAVIAAGAGFSLAEFIIPKRYVSEAVIRVGISASGPDTPAADETALVDTCRILFTSSRVFDELNSHFGNIYTDDQLRKMIKVGSAAGSNLLRITVETGDPQESRDAADELVKLASDEFAKTIGNGSIKTVSPPFIPDKLAFPGTAYFTAGGGAVGLAVSYLFFLIKDTLDTRVKPDDDLTAIYGLPVYAEIPDLAKAVPDGRPEKEQ